jgi:hypothetical protein
VPAVDLAPVDLLVPNEEDTSPIPVDDALLKMSRRGDSLRPPSSAPPKALNIQVPRAAAVPVDLVNPFAPPKRSGSTLLWFVSGVLITAAAGAGIYVTQFKESGSAPAPATAAPAGATLAAPATATTTASGQTPANTPLSQRIKLRIAVSPEDAEVRLDGRLLKSNPYVSEVDRDNLEHELTVSADKHREEKHKLKFDDDIDLELSLESARGGRRVARLVRGARPPVALPPPAEPAAPAAPAPASRPAPKIEPGMDLEARPATRGKSKIDEKDPYAK